VILEECASVGHSDVPLVVELMTLDASLWRLPNMLSMEGDVSATTVGTLYKVVDKCEHAVDKANSAANETERTLINEQLHHLTVLAEFVELGVILWV